jgi:hypothetical protein
MAVYVSGLAQMGGVEHVGQQSLSKVMDAEFALPGLGPIRVVSIAVNTDMLKAWLQRQPLLWPESAGAG